MLGEVREPFARVLEHIRLTAAGAAAAEATSEAAAAEAGAGAAAEATSEAAAGATSGGAAAEAVTGSGAAAAAGGVDESRVVEAVVVPVPSLVPSLAYAHMRFLHYETVGGWLPPHVDLSRTDKYGRTSRWTFILYVR